MHLMKLTLICKIQIVNQRIESTIRIHLIRYQIKTVL